jgi:hypothetical protein
LKRIVPDGSAGGVNLRVPGAKLLTVQATSSAPPSVPPKAAASTPGLLASTLILCLALFATSSPVRWSVVTAHSMRGGFETAPGADAGTDNAMTGPFASRHTHNGRDRTGSVPNTK